MAYNIGKCDSDPNKCRSQVALNRLFRDPVLGPFLESRAINEEDKSSATKLGGYGWISLPTTAKSGVEEDKAKLNSEDDQINFFSVKRYTPEESKVIYEALSSSMSSGKGNGQDIIFDKYGNFAYWNGQINKILHNPIVPRSVNIDNLLVASDESNTLYKKYTKFFSGTNIYYYNTKMIANPQMTYLILTKDKVPSENSIYYLIYNPIHRPKFREYYSHLLGYEGIWEGSKLIEPGSVGAFQNSNVPTVPSANGGQSKTVPGYKKTLARYCNAIKIGGDTLPNGKRAEHYADPTCNFAMDKNEADFSLISGQNFTQSNLAYDRYAPINGTDAEGKARFLSSKQILMDMPGNRELHWPCKAEWDKNLRTSVEFADFVGLLGTRSKSFINLLANAYVNKMGIGSKKNALNIGGENFDGTPSCRVRNVTITSCVNHVDIAGNAKGNDISMQTACGANREPVKTTNNTKNPLVAAQQQTVTGQQQSVAGEPDKTDDNMMIYIIIAVLLLLLTIGLIIFL